MNRSFHIVIIAAVIVLFSLSNSNGFDNKSGGGHNSITNEGADLTKKARGNDYKFNTWLYGKEGESGALPYFLTGVHDEDCTPVIEDATIEVPYDLDWPSGPNKNLWGNFFEHFYNPETGAGLMYYIKGGQQRTAITRAKEYEKYIKGIVCAAGKKTYNDLSPIAKTYVNDYFGRIQHLIEDMGVSYHTKLELHWPLKPIEDFVKNNWNAIV